MRSIQLLAGGVIVLAAMCGCGRYVKVEVPPTVNLADYQTIGLVGFTCDDDQDMRQMSTQRMLESIQAAQPGTRIVELGDEARVLRSVDRRGWNVATYRAIRDRHGVDAIILGNVYLAQRKPDINFSSGVWKAVSVSADVEATLSTRLIETASGATMWADSATGVANVAHGHLIKHGGGGFGVSDPDEVYGAMLNDLVYEVTDDFRVHYVSRRVSKEEQQSASAE